NPSYFVGTIVTESANGASPPRLYLQNAKGVTVYGGGSIVARSGLAVDTLGATWTSGNGLMNQGVIDGGIALWMYGASIGGGGAFRGDGIGIATPGDAHN